MIRVSHPARRLILLAAGDAIALFLVTVFGFAHHGRGLGDFRWLSTFIPLCASWAILSPWFGVYNQTVASHPRQIWRAPLAMILAAPGAAWLRATWLGQATLPSFVPVIAAFAALGIVIWRLLWVIASPRTTYDG